MNTNTHEMGQADLHMHTCHSDGSSTVKALLDYVATQTRLSVIAITDHDTITGALEAQHLLRQGRYHFEVIVGEEVSTRDGHLVGLFLNERIPPGLSAKDTIAAIHAQGGLAFAPHPFFRARQYEGQPITMEGLGTLISDLDLDAIETINATPTLAGANRHAAHYNETRTHLPVLGNSDGHILVAIGKGYTSFSGYTALELYAAIRAGLTTAHACPFRLPELIAYLRFWLHLMWTGQPPTSPPELALPETVPSYLRKQ